jgi:hypothetical protein
MILLVLIFFQLPCIKLILEEKYQLPEKKECQLFEFFNVFLCSNYLWALLYWITLADYRWLTAIIGVVACSGTHLHAISIPFIPFHPGLLTCWDKEEEMNIRIRKFLIIEAVKVAKKGGGRRRSSSTATIPRGEQIGLRLSGAADAANVLLLLLLWMPQFRSGTGLFLPLLPSSLRPYCGYNGPHLYIGGRRGALDKAAGPELLRERRDGPLFGMLV